MFTLTQNRWKIDDGAWPLHGLWRLAVSSPAACSSPALGRLAWRRRRKIGTALAGWALRAACRSRRAQVTVGLRLEEHEGADLIHRIGATPEREAALVTARPAGALAIAAEIRRNPASTMPFATQPAGQRSNAEVFKERSRRSRPSVCCSAAALVAGCGGGVSTAWCPSRCPVRRCRRHRSRRRSSTRAGGDRIAAGGSATFTVVVAEATGRWSTSG